MNSVTSCSFAENVEAAWQASGSGNVTAQPVTGLTYTMYCSGTGPVTCNGANNALVELGMYVNSQGCYYLRMNEGYCPATGTYVPMQDPQAAVPSDPWAVVSKYYADIEAGNYLAAWNMQAPSFQHANDSYASWVAGYANTGAQNLTEVSESGDTVYVNLSDVKNGRPSTSPGGTPWIRLAA